MPHIFTKEFTPFKKKIKTEDLEFEFCAINQNKKENYLILVNYKKTIEFFLEVKRKERGFIIKSEKHTRPSPNYPLHKAINSLSKILNLQILFSNLNLKESQHLKYKNKLRNIEYFIKFFENCKQNIWIEIGFGSGRHLLFQAENNQNVHFIGIEIHKPSIEQVLKQIEIKNLNNIDILDFDARLFLEIIPSNLIKRIFVHFPIPWDKKPHRRVIQNSFIQEVKRILSINGTLELRTDSENYFNSSLKLFLNEKDMNLKILENRQIDILSKYEVRWQSQNKNIYDLILTNQNNSEELIKFNINGFELNSETNFNSNYHNLIGQKYKKEKWFISVKSIYSINETNSKLIEIIMGSYNYPETIFLFISKKKVKYLIKKIMPIKINREIENYLRELL
jgi:tRNA (guanine-N7-)-methyltransferase